MNSISSDLPRGQETSPTEQVKSIIAERDALRIELIQLRDAIRDYETGIENQKPDSAEIIFNNRYAALIKAYNYTLFTLSSKKFRNFY